MRWALFCAVTVALAASASAQDSYIPVLTNGVKQPSYSGMLKPFEYVNKRSSEQTPSTKSPDKAASKPLAANSHPAFHYAPTTHDGAQPARAPLETQSSKPAFRPASASVKLSHGCREGSGRNSFRILPSGARQLYRYGIVKPPACHCGLAAMWNTLSTEKLDMIYLGLVVDSPMR